MIPLDELEEYPKRAQPLRTLVMGLVVSLILGGLAYGFLRPAPEAAGTGNLPEFSLPLLGGEGRLSESDLQGSPVVINFFASWCIPCREELPFLQREWLRNRERGLRVVGVLWHDSPGAALPFARKLGLTFPLLVDKDEVLARAFGIQGIPTTFFVDRSGSYGRPATGTRLGSRSGGVVFGPVPADTLRHGIKELLRSPD